MITGSILDAIRPHAGLFDSPVHGLRHWRTVERNGLYLAQFTAADTAVVSLFAYFHDCMRFNEHHDPGHGPRGASLAKELRRLLPLDDAQLSLLVRACSGLTHGRCSDDATIATCRLDLGRVGITPRARYLLTSEGIRIADETDYGVLHASAVERD